MESNLLMSITFFTRSNDGQVHDHFEDLSSALEYFISESGYRIDFCMPDGQILFIHRGQYGEDIPKEKLEHPAWKQYSQAVSKILLYNPSQVNDASDNVVQVDFNQ
jgi:hypothetical protein